MEEMVERALEAEGFKAGILSAVLGRFRIRNNSKTVR